MNYTFYILTTSGIKSSEISTESDFTSAPFGFVPYRAPCSCSCGKLILDDFWNSVDAVLSANNLSPDEFVRAVRAYDSDGKLYGELPFD